MTSHDDQEDQVDNLPAVQDPIHIDAIHPEVKHFPLDTAESTIKEDNSNYATFQLQVVHQLWDHATSFARVIKLMREQREVVKFRSDVRGIPYGFKSGNNKGDEFTPLD